MSNPQIVIVGAGPAGGTAAKTLRAEGFDGDITVLGAEPHRPYMRPPLSKQYLRGEADRDSVFLESESWHVENRIDLRAGTKVARLDVGARTVHLADGEALRFDSLLLATGSTPRRLDVAGTELGGVHHLRVLEDSSQLHYQLKTGGKKLVIIGSGWIGLEVAASARALGNDVTVVGHSEVPLANALGAELGAYFARLHAANGVDVRGSVTVQRIVGLDGMATAVELSDGTVVDADLVLVAVGAAPNIELAQAAGIKIDNGVTVDERLATSASDVYAAGDIANAWHPAAGARIRSEHFSNALKGGAAAARIMLGQDVRYDDLPTFVSEQFDVTLQFAGYAPLMQGAQVVYRGDPASTSFQAFWLREGRAVAGVNVNVPDRDKLLQGVVRRAAPVTAEQLANPAIALEQL